MFSQPRFLAAARSMLGSLAQRVGFNEIQCGQISLAVDEALCNVINHGYERDPEGRIWVSVWVLTEPRPGLNIVIEDRARSTSSQSGTGISTTFAPAGSGCTSSKR
jgi:anti-sigma regulatory factor (Ser/Thr protein kinase)